MPSLVSLKARAARSLAALFDNVEPAHRFVPGTLGDAIGVVDVPGRTGYAYVRLLGDPTRTVRARNMGVPSVADTSVWVEIVRSPGDRVDYRLSLETDWEPPVPAAHDTLSAQHSDTLAAGVSQGSIVVGNGTPKWAELTIGAADRYLGSDGTDAAWAQVDHAQLSGVTSDQHHNAITLHATLAANLLGLSTQELTLDNQDANLIFAGPNAGGTAAPTFRSLVAADIPAHDILSAQHGDTLAAGVSRGSIIVGNATPKWAELTIGAANTHLESDGADIAWQANITMADGATIGQAAGPLIAFDDTNNYLEITGCNVGIGTTRPITLLHLYGGAGGGATAWVNAELVIEDNSDVAIELISPSTSSGQIRFSDNVSATGLIAYRHGTSPFMDFWVDGTEKVRIDGNGNVGIGVTDPDTKLEVFGSTGLKISFDATDNTTLVTDTNGDLTITPSGDMLYLAGKLNLASEALLGSPEAGTLEFYNNKFYITNEATQKAIDRTSDVAIETVTVTNTTVETTLWTAEMAANSLEVGNVFRFLADGIVSSASASDTVTIRVRVGGDVKMTLVSEAKKLEDDHWHLEANATQRTLGVSGSRAMHMDLVIGDYSTEIIAIGTIDTTANMDVTVTAQWNAAKAGNTISLYQGFMGFRN